MLPISGRRSRTVRFGLATALIAVVLGVQTGCADRSLRRTDDSLCDVEEIRADRESSVPRPEIEGATFSFDGNMPGQVDFVFLRPDGSYDYVERWEAGDPRMLGSGSEVGWNWKVGCRMHRCRMRDGSTCCHQTCRDGGRARFGYESPDASACMNSAAGGRYDWFVIGLRDGGMSELNACGVAEDAP